MRGKIKEHLFIKEIYGDGMNLFRNESHSGKMNGSSLKLELYERIYENKQTTTQNYNLTQLLFSLCVLLSVHF